MNDTNESNKYELLMEALVELKPEIEAHLAEPVPALPTMSAVLADFGPLPRESLLLGVAEDGLPVMLNLHDSIPGPLLITADPGAGKTAFLQTIARAVEQLHTPQNVQFGVVTNFPDEWTEFVHVQNCVGIFPFYQNSSQDFILSLASWAHANKNARQSVLLLVDDLDAMSKLDFDAQQNLRWLLLRGPTRRVWPMITLNAQRVEQTVSWLETFRTRIFGRIQDTQVADRMGAEKAGLGKLLPGSQFTLREGLNWLRFWIPTLD